MSSVAFTVNVAHIQRMPQQIDFLLFLTLLFKKSIQYSQSFQSPISFVKSHRLTFSQ